MNIDKTLKTVMAKRNITLCQLSDKSGIALETIRNIYYCKIHDPKVSTMLKLSQALDLSINYLCGDLHYKDDERELLKHYRNSSSRGKSVIQLFAKVESDMSDKERTSDKYIITCLIPIGTVTDGIKYHSCNSVKIETDNPDAFLAIEVTTDYFSPAYCMGDRVLLANRFPNDGEYAVFLIDDYAYLRQYQKHDSEYTLRCVNSLGKDMTFKRLDGIQCIGTLIGLTRT